MIAAPGGVATLTGRPGPGRPACLVERRLDAQPRHRGCTDGVRNLGAMDERKRMQRRVAGVAAGLAAVAVVGSVGVAVVAANGTTTASSGTTSASDNGSSAGSSSGWSPSGAAVTGGTAGGGHASSGGS